MDILSEDGIRRIGSLRGKEQISIRIFVKTPSSSWCVLIPRMLSLSATDLPPQTAQVIDAKAVDGTLVAIKSVPGGGREVEVAQYLTSIRHPENHCVPVLDAFPDPLYPGRSLMVMPYLRPFNDPEFIIVGDAVDFVSQMLEVRGPTTAADSIMLKRVQGLAFMHSHNVVHRYVLCAESNESFLILRH